MYCIYSGNMPATSSMHMASIINKVWYHSNLYSTYCIFWI